MKVLYDNLGWEALLLISRIPADQNVTVLHLGRGGVQDDGSLDDYNQSRVEATVRVASFITAAFDATVRIVWSGGHNRNQAREVGIQPPSEGGVALRYARTVQGSYRFKMAAEEFSTSTVENATNTASAELIPDDHVIIIVTDELHYTMGKVQFIMWLVFPEHQRIYIELPDSPPGTNWKTMIMHLISTTITVVGMIGVPRGDAAKVRDRQKLLEPPHRALSTPPNERGQGPD